MKYLGCLTWVKLQQPQEQCYPFLPLCAVSVRVQTMVQLSTFGIFDVHTDADACACTQEPYEYCKSALKVYSKREKNPCCTGKLSHCQYCAWLTQVWHDLLKCNMTYWSITWFTKVWHDLLKCDITYLSVTWLTEDPWPTEVWPDLLKCDMINWSKMYALLKCGMTYEVRWFTEMWHNPVQHNATYWSVPWLTEMWHGILKWDVCLTDMVWLTELRHGMLKCDITQCSVTQFT